MANTFRGEVDLVIGGKPYAVALNLEALAKLAKALEVDTITELEQRLVALRIADMMPILTTLLEANGHKVEQTEIGAVGYRGYVRAIVDLCSARPPAEDGDEAGDAGEASPPKRAA